MPPFNLFNRFNFDCGASRAACVGAHSWFHLPNQPLATSTILPTTPPFPSARSFWMNTLARHDVGHGHTCGLHPHPRFTGLRLGGLFFNHPKRIGPAILRDDDARVSRELLTVRNVHETHAHHRHAVW